MRYRGVTASGLAAIGYYQRPLTKCILFLGHPRCGSGYSAGLARAVGMDVGHEEMGEHGIASWMFAAQDLVAPFGTGPGAAPLNVTFHRTVHHLRNPFDAVPSIMTENNVTLSFRYRRAHVEDVFGFDLLRYDRALDRAVASYLFWNKLIELRRPNLTFRIEDQDKLLIDYLQSEFSHLATKSIELDKPPPSNTFSDHFSKLGVTKPALSSDDWSKLDRDLREPLRQFCKTYGYDCRTFNK